MTPQPQQEYIITEEQVKIIEKILGYDSQTLHDVRSRPAPAAPGIRCCESCKNIPCKPLNRIPCVYHPENPCVENGCTDIENCDEICENTRLYSPAWLAVHDTNLAATIRNQTLDAIMDCAETDGEWFRNDGTIALYLNYSVLSKKAESLRSTKSTEAKK